MAVLLCIAVAIAWRFLPLGLFTLVLDQNPGPFDRARMQQIVDRVRLLGIKPGEDRNLRLDDLSNPSSLRVTKPQEVFPRGEGAGNVYARVSANGELTAVIETKDLGHAGEYGFAYTELNPTPDPNYAGVLNVDAPCPLKMTTPDMKIDAHWWKVLYNLD